MNHTDGFERVNLMYRKYPTFLVFPYICLFSVSFGLNALGVSAKNSETGAADKVYEEAAATNIDYAFVPGRKFRPDLFDLEMFPGWYKPCRDLPEYKGNSSLTMKLSSDGKAELNPINELDPEGKFGYKYHVIDLHNLSIENAEMLWGKGRGGKTEPECTLTFDLIEQFSGTEHNVFHLDLKFFNDKLISYRLRGINITKPEWNTVK
jgi:hypothetical protein